MKSQDDTNVDLETLTDIQLITELIGRGITPDDFASAYIHVQESYYHLKDETEGYSGAGLHGKGANR